MNNAKIRSSIFKRINLFDPDDKLGLLLQDTRFQVSFGFGPAPDGAFILAANIPLETNGTASMRPDIAVEVWLPGKSAPGRSPRQD